MAFASSDLPLRSWLLRLGPNCSLEFDLVQTKVECSSEVEAEEQTAVAVIAMILYKACVVVGFVEWPELARVL